MIIKEALSKLHEIDNPMLPAKAARNELVAPDNDLDRKLIAKINTIAKALANAFEDEGIDLDANLIANDIRRDCGLMGEIVSTDVLDDNNPFDAATRQMHDMGPVDRNMACQMLLNVPPHEFVSVFMNGLKRDRNLLPPGAQRRALPHRGMPRRIGEAKEKDYSYINILVNKYAPMCKTCNKEKVDEEVLTEKVQDLKAYFKKNLKDKFEQLGLNERDFLKIVALDPTFKQGSNAAGDYFEWLLRMLTRKDSPMTYEDMMHIGREWTDVLTMYNDYKKRNKLPADKKDIMRFKTFEELFSFMQSLGGDIKADVEEGTSFKEAIKNIRGALISICGFKDEEIPAEIKSTGDCLTFCGETDKWELYRIESIWGAMLADTYGIDWGAGATWCTGGQYCYTGQPRKGMELYNSAHQHYGNYTGGGTSLFFFAQKDNSVLRPKNKIQLQLASDGYKVSNVFHADDNPISINDDGTVRYEGWGNNSGGAEAFGAFLKEENLVDMVKKTPLGGCESIKDAETAEALARGEPYIYGGERIKEMFKQDVKEIKFKEGYDFKVRSADADGNRVEVIGIPIAAFSGCVNLEKVEIPVDVVQIQANAFKGCDKVHIIIPRFPDRPFKFNPRERDFYAEHAFYDDGEPILAFAKKNEEPAE